MRHSLGSQPERIVPRAELEVRCVCNTCNGGWMHDLEELNIPLIGCLMQDLALHLDRKQQQLIAKWAIKTSMVQDAIYTKSRTLFYTALEREAARRNTSLPEFTRVWLGRLSFSTLSADGFDIALTLHDRRREVSEPADGCVSTFVVGHLVLQIITVHVPEKYDRQRPFEMTTVIDAPWDDLLIPIGGTNAINWPPRLHFINGSGITKLNHRLRGGMPKPF
jgi:hypothetical protein